MGAGRLSYPIHSRATLACHPLLCVLAPSALLSWGFFFLVFRLSLSLSLCLYFPCALSSSIAPCFSRSCPIATPPSSPSHPRAFSVSFAAPNFHGHVCARVHVCARARVPPPLCGLVCTFSCVYTRASKEIVVLASYTTCTELRRAAIRSNIKKRKRMKKGIRRRHIFATTRGQIYRVCATNELVIIFSVLTKSITLKKKVFYSKS